MTTHATSTSDATHPWLNTATREYLDLSAVDRVDKMLRGSWMPLGPSESVLSVMEKMLRHPGKRRTEHLLVVGESNSGKTTLLDKFRELHVPVDSAGSEATEFEVVSVECPWGPDVGALFSNILDSLFVPYKATASAAAKASQAGLMFDRLKVKILMIDEINNSIQGTRIQQNRFRNAIKSFGNMTSVRIVAAGTHDALNALTIDKQLASRFQIMALPQWSKPNDLGRLLKTIEKNLPLRKASGLAQPALIRAVRERAEDGLGDICSLLYAAAEVAINSGEEQITLDTLKAIQWTAPSKRRDVAKQLAGI